MKVKNRRLIGLCITNGADYIWRPKGIEGIGVVESRLERNSKISCERRFYITSLNCIEKFSKGVREHWGIENSLHWTLDVAFNEDRSTRKLLQTVLF